MGWLLHDDEPFVRLAATRALLFLYPPPGATLGGLSADAAHSRTEDFMTRFRRRVADMAAADADPRVARRAVALLHRALLAGQLTTDEISRARHAIWSTDESGAVESGSLLISVEADFHADGSGAEGAGARGGKAGAAAAAARAVRNKLTCLINIAASAAPDGCDWIFKLVRAVWGQPGAEFLSDWPAFAALLSAKDGHADELDERATVCALAMLAAALSLLSEQTDGGDEAAALAAASTALGPALADALGRHLGSAPLVPPLLGTLTRLDPAAAFSSSAGGGKTLASVLYALSRAVSQHSSFVELEALSKTLVHLAAGDYPRARDAAAAVTKLGATLSANAARLVSLKPTALTADARGELELSLRRLRALHSAAAGALPPGTLPELDPVDLIAAAGADKRAALMAHKLLGPLFRAARARGTSRGVRAVFEHTKKPRGEGADAAFLEALAPGVAEEALHLLGVAATAAVARAIAACKSLKKVATAAERSTAAATVTAAVVLRDATLGIATAAMTLAHPSTLKTLGLDDGAGADADADADADVDPPLLSPADAFASLALPATLTAAERVYVLRARAAGFSVLCIVGTACGRALATADGLGALAWSPSGATARYITAYLNEALKAPARDVCALAPFGGVEWGVSGGDESIFGVLEDAAGDADAEAEEAEDVDALEWTEVRDALTASGATAPDDKAARDALVAARARRLELRDSFTRKARADALLTPIAALSTALPDADRVGQQVVFRSMVEYNEAGEFGLEVVRAHAERLAAAGAGAGDGPAVVDGVRALIRMQLRCISDASKTHASILVDTRQKIAAAAAAPRDGAAADERAAALAELLGFQTGLRSMTASHVRMLCEKGKVARSVAANLATALHDAAKAALRAPASQEFVFIAIIGYVPHIGTKKDCVALGEKIAALVDVGGAASGLPPEEALKVHAADAWWEKICAREAQALALEDIAGVPVDDIRAYVPLAALRALLARGGSCSSSDVDKITSRVLKALCGPGVYDAPKAAAARGVDEEEEEAEEGGEGEGGDGDGGRAARIRSRGRRRAPAAERADEDADDVETPPKDAADADDDDDDDEDVAPTRKSKTRAGGRGGGAAALKKAAAVRPVRACARVCVTIARPPSCAFHLIAPCPHKPPTPSPTNLGCARVCSGGRRTGGRGWRRRRETHRHAKLFCPSLPDADGGHAGGASRAGHLAHAVASARLQLLRARRTHVDLNFMFVKVSPVARP